MNARSLRPLVVLVSLLCADVEHAGWAACESASRKAVPDDQIRLYTVCIANGQLHRWELAYALTHRAYAYSRKGELDRALADVDQALVYNPDHVGAYQLRGFIHATRLQWDLAEQDFTTFIERTSRRYQANAYVNRAVMRFCHDSCAGALRDLDQALAIDPKQPYAYGLKARVLSTCSDEQARNGAEAVGLAQKALSLRNDWWSHATLAAAFAETGQFADSIREVGLAQTMLGSKGAAARDLGDLAEQRTLYETARPYRKQSGETICFFISESDAGISETDAGADH